MVRTFQGAVRSFGVHSLVMSSSSLISAGRIPVDTGPSRIILKPVRSCRVACSPIVRGHGPIITGRSWVIISHGPVMLVCTTVKSCQVAVRSFKATARSLQVNVGHFYLGLFITCHSPNIHGFCLVIKGRRNSNYR